MMFSHGETLKNRIPTLLPGLLLAVSMLGACGFLGAANDLPAMETPASVETIQTAAYIPQASETPSTKLWGHTQASCDGKSLYAWREAGTFTWRFSYRDYEEVAIVTLPEAAYTVPGDDACGWLSVGLGETMKDAPIEGAKSQWSGSCQTTTGGSTKTIVQQIVSMVSGWEEKTIQLGTFRALRVKSLNQYVDGRTPGIVEVNDWYVCGYGRVYSESIDLDNDIKYVDELLSFTSQFTNEARVRYILADIQLTNTPEPYRASIADEETAEALRRWDAGVRVVNIDQFERASVNGEWQIVPAGSGRPINGTDIRLTGDPQP
jgi:hypothetical protein